MFKWIIRIIFAFIVFVVGFYIYTIRHPLQLVTTETEYYSERQFVYALVNAEEFDAETFKAFVLSQANFSLSDWPHELWWSITFNDPRGGITIYQDTLMGMAVGIKRLYDKEDPSIEIDNAVHNILNRRTYVWHDFHGTNHYAREYAALAALAKTVGDTRYPLYQNRLHDSLAKLYGNDGYPLEGPSYGLYTVSLLAPYVYITGDEDVQPIIYNFHDWLEGVAAADGSLPLFEDAPALQLPISLSAYAAVNESYTDWQFSSADDPVTSQVNETVLRSGSDTLWLRHVSRKNTLNMHRHFTSLDILMKQGETWWLVASGYPGYDQKFDRPFLQNIVTHDSFLENNWYWRLKGLLLGKKPVIERLNDHKWQLSLGTLDRMVTLTDDGWQVIDRDARPFTVYWNIMGELRSKQLTGEGYSLEFVQGDQTLVVTIAGIQDIQFLQGRHSLDKKNIDEHTVVKITGSKIISGFSLR